VLHKGKCVGTVVCKMDRHRGQQFRGYIAMLVVDKPYRKLRLGSKLVCAAFKVCVCVCVCGSTGKAWAFAPDSYSARTA
jgi:hypothetical protein